VGLPDAPGAWLSCWLAAGLLAGCWIAGWLLLSWLVLLEGCCYEKSPIHKLSQTIYHYYRTFPVPVPDFIICASNKF
jgi:hypothetical protein